MEFATESVDNGKILIMSIELDEGNYSIKITKVDGTLTHNMP